MRRATFLSPHCYASSKIAFPFEPLQRIGYGLVEVCVPLPREARSSQVCEGWHRRIFAHARAVLGQSQRQQGHTLVPFPVCYIFLQETWHPLACDRLGASV